MAKKDQSNSSKSVILILILAAIAGGGWWLWQHPQMVNWKDRVLQYVDNRDIVTLEARYLPEQIIEAHRKELLNGKKTLQNTLVKYYPYLLLDVKYPDLTKTREGMLVWGLTEGEIILNTDTWEATHGFHDCLECQADRSDFKVLQTLARRAGSSTFEDLQKELHVERETLQMWIEAAKKKGLVIQKGNVVQLHFENPKILVTPQTRVNQPLVSKPMKEALKVPRTYSPNQIRAMTQTAFGKDFIIRNEQEIFLPVYSFEILNPDGSIQVSEWNALTGQQIVPRYLF